MENNIKNLQKEKQISTAHIWTWFPQVAANQQTRKQSSHPRGKKVQKTRKRKSKYIHKKTESYVRGTDF
jgi:hypothetical protein